MEVAHAMVAVVAVLAAVAAMVAAMVVAEAMVTAPGIPVGTGTTGGGAAAVTGVFRSMVRASCVLSCALCLVVFSSHFTVETGVFP